jgi:hypothetical protein
MHPEVGRQQRVAQRARLDREARAAADHGLTALRLVRPEEDPGPIQLAQRALDALVLDQPGEVAPLAAGELQQPAIGTPKGRVDRPPDEVEEDRLPLEKPPADHAVRGVGRRGTPKEDRQTEEQAGSAAEVAGAGAPGAPRRQRSPGRGLRA